MAIESITPEAAQAPADEAGELVCTRPFPCMPLGFWPLPGYGEEADVVAAQKRFHESYFSEFDGIWCKRFFSFEFGYHILVFLLLAITFLIPFFVCFFDRSRRSYRNRTFETWQWRRYSYARAFRWCTVCMRFT